MWPNLGSKNYPCSLCWKSILEILPACDPQLLDDTTAVRRYWWWLYWFPCSVIKNVYYITHHKSFPDQEQTFLLRILLELLRYGNITEMCSFRYRIYLPVGYRTSSPLTMMDRINTVQQRFIHSFYGLVWWQNTRWLAFVTPKMPRVRTDFRCSKSIAPFLKSATLLVSFLSIWYDMIWPKSRIVAHPCHC